MYTPAISNYVLFLMYMYVHVCTCTYMYMYVHVHVCTCMCSTCRRLNVVEYFKSRHWESDWLVAALKSVCDLERFMQKASCVCDS